MYFVISLILTAAAMAAFCFVQWDGVPLFAGPDNFVPGLLAMWIIGVALGVVALRADRG